jgi:hypothetical protein
MIYFHLSSIEYHAMKEEGVWKFILKYSSQNLMYAYVSSQFHAPGVPSPMKEPGAHWEEG